MSRNVPAATATIQLRVPGGWDALGDPALYEDLRTVHATLRSMYDRVGEACLTGLPPPLKEAKCSTRPLTLR